MVLYKVFVVSILSYLAALMGGMNVVGVHDGDTINVGAPSSKDVIKVRLYGIDAPELKQDYGLEALQCAKSYLASKRVKVHTFGTDLYQRVLGEVYVGNRNINLYLVQMGCAWATPQYLPKEKQKLYMDMQLKAQIAKIGLWYRPDPVKPWEWRKRK